MKDLLYLKDEQIKDFINYYFMLIEKLLQIQKKFYRRKFFGPALRTLNLMRRIPGISLR